MKTIMYIQNVPWSWIKQRPHFIAEVLSKYYKVDVYSKIAYQKTKKTQNYTLLDVFQMFRLPFERISVVQKISDWIVVLQLKKKIKKYDYIWITDPRIYFFLKKYIRKEQIIIFDCMDDYIEFPGIKKDKNAICRYISAEKKILKDAKYIFISSAYLKNVLEKRHSGNDCFKMDVINNAVSNNLLKIVKNTHYTHRINRMRKVIVYIGTISSWMDFELIKDSLDRYNGIEYHFYGPKEVELPSNERIIYKGILEHKDIMNIMKQADMLVMPFLLNDLVLSVNPVKLYEYILSETPTVAVKYSESEKFGDFIYLYENKEEYLLLVKKLERDELIIKNKNNIQEFIENNTWDHRAIEITKILEAE